jgi:ATPase subunit of ABC transporter with duplicated ATPase domains
MNKPIIIKDISLHIDQKICFERFSTQVNPGKNIVIMGANGAGKSTLLKILQGIMQPTDGQVIIPKDTVFGYVPQTVTDYPDLSGGQRFNKSLSQALSLSPDVLCLDEPTNHLDRNNRRSLIRMLQNYAGTLIVVSHDPEILELDFDEIWHIEHGKITVFTGNYTEYLVHNENIQLAQARQRELLLKEKQALRKAVQQEHKRAGQSRAVNKDEPDKNLLGAMKESGSHTEGKNLKRLSSTQESIQQKLAGNFVHKVIKPKFNLDTHVPSSSKAIVSVVSGSCGYAASILHDINLNIQSTERIAIAGDNGTGKSTLLKAFLRDPRVTIEGQWTMPAQNNIGYLDQHYSTLNPEYNALEVIQEVAHEWGDLEVRKHLNDFLFRTQHEVTTQVKNLSGGEKARLCLAYIAAQSPQLLLLDEITNNVDLQTRAHIIEVLKEYPGSMIIVTHDSRFLQALSVATVFETKAGLLTLSEI